MGARPLTALRCLLVVAAVAWFVPTGNISGAPYARQTPQTAPVPVRSQPAQPAVSSGFLFIENVGQFDSPAHFQAHFPQGMVNLVEDGIWLTILEKPSTPQFPLPFQTDLGEAAGDSQPLRGVNLRLSYSRANPKLRVEGFSRSETAVSYFLGDNPAHWRPDVPVWRGVRYVDIYPGVDLEVTGGDGGLTQRFVVREGDLGFSALEQASLRVEGATDLSVEEEGQLRIATEAGVLTLELARVELIDTAGGMASPATAEDNRPLVLDGVPRVAGSEVVFPFRPTTSTPSLPSSQSVLASSSSLAYSTFLGGSSVEYGNDIVVDAAGNAYVTGSTRSANFPATPGSFQLTPGGGTCSFGYGILPCSDAFVAKLNSSGSALIYATFLGGNSSDSGARLAVDGTGNAYLTGSTSSADFPATPGAFQDTYAGGTCGTSVSTYPCNDAFVAKLNPSGNSLEFATLLGGGGDENGHGISLDSGGSIYVTGSTSSSNFPVTHGTVQTARGGNSDAFVTKLNPTGTALIYSTFLGGYFDDAAFRVAVSGVGDAYVTGYTLSFNFPTTSGAYDTTFGAPGLPDAFVAKLNPSAAGLTYATFLGGDGSDYGFGIAIDSTGNAYIAGSTSSSNFPTTQEAFQTTLAGHYDAYVAKLDPSGTSLVYSTFLGGSTEDWGWGLAINSAGNAYVTGRTSSDDFPTTPETLQTTRNIPPDAFMVRLDAIGSAPNYSTFLGGNFVDEGQAIVVDSDGEVYIAGYTQSTDFPTTEKSVQTTFGGGICPSSGAEHFCPDTFVAKLSIDPPDFKLSATPASQSIKPGEATTVALAVQPLRGFTTTVTLSLPTPPPDLALSLSPVALTPPDIATLIITDTYTGPLQPAAAYTLTISGTGGGITHTIDIGLVVGSPRIYLPVVLRNY